MHLAVIAVLAAFAQVASAPTPPRERRLLTFVMMAPPPAPNEPAPSLVLPVAVVTPPSPLPEARERETPPVAAKPIARSEPAPSSPEPPRPAPPIVVAPPPKPTPAPPRTPPVSVGLFADAAPTVHEAEPIKPVRAAGFDAPSPIAKSGDTKSAAVVGAFDPAVAGQTAIVARAGAPVASAGFGNARADAGGIKPPPDVRATGFDAVRQAAPSALRPAAAAERIDVPLEITFKPAPVYTEEARALKLEGDVLLDVEFAAGGTITVRQVVRGLGHGLDEAATTAAKQIRFKPAQADGRPISFRTTVHIIFRLA